MAAPPADTIVLRGIAALGRHGVLGEERTRAQPFEVDLEIEGDLGAAGEADDLSLTIDYGKVVAAVVRTIEDQSFQLLEALATAIAGEVLAFAGADAVTVEVRKLRPPVAFHLCSAAVRLRREAP